MKNINEEFIGQELSLGMLNNAFQNLMKGKGSITCISGETGMGKTYLLKHFQDIALSTDNVSSVYVQCQVPIGNFNVADIQPLQPFSRIVENLIENKGATAEKKFARNVGMTVLSNIPFVGNVLYTIKELDRDWRQFKKEKTTEESKNVGSGASFFYQKIIAFAQKIPLLLMIDDLHWSDAQSVELINYFADNIANYPVMLVLTYKKSVAESKASPLMTFVAHHQSSPNIFHTELESFNLYDIRDCCGDFIENYKPNTEFEELVFNKSFGVPGVVIEYMKYFGKNNPFDREGNIKENLKASQFVPSTVHSAFAQTLEILTEHERNILAVCSAEGREFTAIVVAHLLNTDVLTAIKEIRGIQNKAGVVKSIGARSRYGMTTTVYEFTQAFYHSYFENTLEYEEHVALHGQIASFLKQKYDETPHEELRHQIAPYIAAHSSEAGDEETTKTMLLEAAKTANDLEAFEVVNHAFSSYLKMTGDDEESQKNSSVKLAFQELLRQSIKPVMIADGNAGDTESLIEAGLFVDFHTLRKMVVDDYHNKDYSTAADKAITYYNSREKELRPIEQAQLIALTVKCYTELADYTAADKYAEQAIKLINSIKEPIADCFVMNAVALYYYAIHNEEEANKMLRTAAEAVIYLPQEMRLLTLSNIALILNKYSKTNSNKYLNAIRKLSRNLRFEELATDVFDRI